MTFFLYPRRREHNLEGWPRLSLSVNDAARSEGVPVSISSLPSDVDAAEMAAFVPFGPKAHRTTPASSWRTNSVHTMPRRQVSHLSWGILNCFQGFQREREPLLMFCCHGVSGHQIGRTWPGQRVRHHTCSPVGCFRSLDKNKWSGRA